MARENKVMIRLTDDIKNDFKQMAEDYGMTISALGSYVIGKYVQEEKRKRKLQEEMLNPMVEKVSQNLDYSEFENMFKSIFKVEGK